MSSTSAGQTSYSLVSVQLLRAIAAMSVVFFHMETVPQVGVYGVDIFFVISGFVMAMVTANNASPGSFLLNRLIRIVPLYWILTTALAVVVVVKPDLILSTTFNFGNYLKSLFFIPYFKESGLLQPFLFVGWTLNYEMLFYACMTAGLIVSHRWHLLIAIVLLVGLHVLFGHLSDSALLREYFGNLKIFEFILGIAAYFGWRSRLFAGIPPYLLAAICLGCFTLMAYLEVTYPDADDLFRFGIPSFALVLCAVHLESFTRSPSLRWLAGVLGDSSYAIYLSHAYVIALMLRVILKQEGWLKSHYAVAVLLALVVSATIGYLIYRLIDRPIHQRLKRLARQSR